MQLSLLIFIHPHAYILIVKFKEIFCFFTHTYAVIALQSMTNITFAAITAVRIDTLVPFTIHCGAFVYIWKR